MLAVSEMSEDTMNLKDTTILRTGRIEPSSDSPNPSKPSYRLPVELQRMIADSIGPKSLITYWKLAQTDKSWYQTLWMDEVCFEKRVQPFPKDENSTWKQTFLRHCE